LVVGIWCEEAFMSNSFLRFFAVALLTLTCLPLQGGSQQQTAPAPAPPPTPAPAPALTPPETVAPPPAAPVKNPVTPTAESQAKAKSLYRIDCALCHGDNGNGKTDLATSMELTLDNWTDPNALAGKQDWELFNVIRVGKGKMPPESKGRASDNDVWNLVIYIRSFSK
jgi:mono/diheme cytochrome c family protein